MRGELGSDLEEVDVSKSTGGFGDSWTGWVVISGRGWAVVL